MCYNARISLSRITVICVYLRNFFYLQYDIKLVNFFKPLITENMLCLDI